MRLSPSASSVFRARMTSSSRRTAPVPAVRPLRPSVSYHSTRHRGRWTCPLPSQSHSKRLALHHYPHPAAHSPPHESAFTESEHTDCPRSPRPSPLPCPPRSPRPWRHPCQPPSLQGYGRERRRQLRRLRGACRSSRIRAGRARGGSGKCGEGDAGGRQRSI